MRHPDPRPGPLPDAGGLRFAIVVSRFNVAITGRLLEAARAALADAGAAPGDVEVLSVPGAFEVPQAARAVAEGGRVDAVICLGCVIRGATAHFEYISASVAHGIQQASGETGVPMTFGVLTTDTWEQAEERDGGRSGEQGVGSGGRGHRDGAAGTPSPHRCAAMSRVDAAGLRRARAAALQMLYQWEVGRVSADEAIVTYWPSRDEEEDLPEPLREFANGLVNGTVRQVAEIDALLAAHAQNWRVERMAVLDRLVLRLAVHEMLTAPGTPPRVVINEALELAREYTGDEAVGFVNGILDAVRKQLGRE